MKNKYLKSIIYILLICGISFGITLTMKANVGVDAWDALSQSGSAITNIPIGTVGMCLNFICIFIQLIILKNNFKFKHILQIGLSILLGFSVNFFYYHVLSNFNIYSYIGRIFLLILGNVINAFVVAQIMLLDIVTFPLEGACKVFADKVGISFPKLRQSIDFISILIVLCLTFIFKIDLYVREGTVIGMLIFSPMMGYFMKISKFYK